MKTRNMIKITFAAFFIAFMLRPDIVMAEQINASSEETVGEEDSAYEDNMVPMDNTVIHEDGETDEKDEMEVQDEAGLDVDYDAGDEISDGTFMYVVNEDEDTLTVTGLVYYTSDIEDIVILSVVDGRTVTAIGESAFYQCSEFTGGLTIPNSVTTIGDYAFSGCSGLTGSLTIPNSTTTIGKSSFSGCSGLTGSLTIPNKVATIGDNAFSGCSGLTGSLTIPNSVTTIGGWAFDDCSGLTGSLTIPDSVTTIGTGAFYGCSGFTGGLTIPNSVTTIGGYAFDDCSGFTGNLAIGNSVATIGSSAFSGCSGFTGNLMLPNSVTTIGDYAFYDCNFTGSLTIPNSVITIGDKPFCDCIGFDKVINKSKSDLVLPTRSEDHAWWDINEKETKTVINTGTVIDIACKFDDGTFTYKIDDDNGKTLTVTGLRNSSKLVMNPSIPSIVDGRTVTVIGKDAFYNSRSIITGKLTLPNTITTIEEDAFCGCEYLTGNFTLPNTVKTIGTGAFYQCSGFTGNLTIPNSVTTIGRSAFEDCSGFTGNLTIPNSVTTIGGWAFEDCSGFTGKLTIGNSVTTIGDYAFEDCSGFTGGLTIPNSVTAIGRWAFYGCSGFTGSLTLSNSVLTISDHAFNGCSGFTGNLTIPNSVTTIEDSAFLWCSGFTGSLTIPNSVTTIEDSAFSRCTSIKKVVSNTIQPCKASWFFRNPDNGYFLSGAGEKILGNGVLRKGTYTKYAGVDRISFDTSYVETEVGKSITLKTSIEPADATNQKVTWKSDKPRIASVSSKGVVTGKGGGTATITVTTEDGGKTASCTVYVKGPERPKPSINNAKVKLSQASYTYDKKEHIPDIASIDGKRLYKGTDYTMTIVNTDGKVVPSPKAAGTYIMIIAGTGDYTGSTGAKYVINKAKNPVKVTGKTATVRYSKLKKKKQTIKCSDIIGVSKSKGKVTYKKTDGNSKISIDEKTGEVTIKKGLKKKTYSVKVKVTDSGSKNYKKTSKTVTVKIVVK